MNNFCNVEYLQERLAAVCKERDELREVNILLKANQDHFKEERDHYKHLYIELLKDKDDDLCEKCRNRVQCEGKKCPDYTEGRGGFIDGRAVDFAWSCEDFNHGTCARLENTPCNGCFDDDFSGFMLKEDKT